MKVIQIFLSALLLVQLSCSLQSQKLTSINSVIPPKDLLRYMNEARTNPKAFAKYVTKEMAQFINNKSLPLLPKFTYRTK